MVCPLLIACNTDDIQQTNEELTIWTLYDQGYSSEYTELTTAMNEFKKVYPDVTLNIEKFETTTSDFDENINYNKKLAAACMSGDGPDMLYIDTVFPVSNDIYKMQQAGAFADLTEFMKKDRDFHKDDYNQVILNGVKFKGKQFIMPISYSIPLFSSTKEAIEKSKINVSKCNNSNGLIEELNSYWERNKNVENAPHLFPEPREFKFFYQYMNLPIIDYENSTANINNDLFKKGLEFWKLAYNLEEKSGMGYQPRFVPTYFPTGKYALGLEAICSFDEYFMNMRALRMIGEPVTFPWYDENGGIQANLCNGIMINSNSENKNNAWNFIKLTLSQASQERLCYLLGGIPILKSSWDICFKKYTQVKVCTGELEESKGLPQSDLEDFKKLQDEITGVYMRFPTDRDFYDLLIPYFEGKKSYDEIIKEAQSFLDIYLSE